MSALSLSYAFMTMLVALALLDVVRGRGYVCPSCGTTNAREHASHCSWKRYYESEEDE